MGQFKTETIRVQGMFCTNCEDRVQKTLEALEGVSSAKASFSRGTVVVTYDAEQVRRTVLEEEIRKLGYETVADSRRIVQTVSVLIILLAVYVIADHFGWTRVFNIFPVIESTMDLGMLFVIGLLTSVHCIVMCGGINLTQSTVAARGGGDIIRHNLLYNAGRVISYTVIGGAVGALGSVLSFSNTAKAVITVAVGIIMVLMALSMLGVFRPLRALPLHLPQGLYRALSGRARGGSSLIVGLLNGFMPCGPLQAMQIYALSAGSMPKGALSMFLFSLGTVPLMLGFGVVSGKMNRKKAAVMLTVSAVLIFVMGIHMAGNGLSLAGVSAAAGPGREKTVTAEYRDDMQYVTTQVDYGSYEPFRVKKGIPVKWTIVVPEGRLNGCNSEIIVPALDLDIRLHEGENEVVFTPNEKGTIPYSCWMGMIKSTIEVTG